MAQHQKNKGWRGLFKKNSWGKVGEVPTPCDMVKEAQRAVCVEVLYEKWKQAKANFPLSVIAVKGPDNHYYLFGTDATHAIDSISGKLYMSRICEEQILYAKITEAVYNRLGSTMYEQRRSIMTVNPINQ